MATRNDELTTEAQTTTNDDESHDLETYGATVYKMGYKEARDDQQTNEGDSPLTAFDSYTESGRYRHKVQPKLDKMGDDLADKFPDLTSGEITAELTDQFIYGFDDFVSGQDRRHP